MSNSNTDDGSGLAGQRGLTDSNSEFNVQNFIIDQALGRVNTLKLVKVMSVNNAGEVAAVGYVDVMPLVNQIDGLGNSTPHATIYGIPYFRIQGGKNAVIMDPVVGDIGLMVCADRDISAVKSTKAQANPGSKRRFSFSDGVYIGGILNGVPEQYITFTSTGIKIADKNSNTIEMKSGEIDITATNVKINGGLEVTGLVKADTNLEVAGLAKITGNLQLGGSMVALSGATYSGNFTTSGNITTTTGEVTAGTIGLKTHHHTAQGALAATTAAQP